jgi:F0F1-type ATP synthase delta subunit
MEKVYAKALQNLITRGMREDEAYEKLRTHLTATGRMKLLPGLLRELKVIRERSQARSAVLEVASANDSAEAEEAAKREGITATAVVNPALVTGWRLTTGDTLIDRSGKRALVDLYRSIVKGN